MKFNQYYLDCLSHASYLIGDETTGRAVVVDPQRDVSEYLADAEELGMTIELNPVLWGRMGVDVLAQHLKGETVKPQVFIKHVIIDSTNVDEKMPKG